MDTAPAVGTRQRILIVDDNPVIIKGLSNLLKASGFEVLAALEGSKAIATVRCEKLDLILLDLNFPADVASGGGVPWDGFLIMDWLHRMGEGENIPIIVITSDEPEKSDQRALAAGVRKVFHKPLDYPALLAAIREVLGPAPAPT